jgi:hypothetical protein
MNRSVCIALMIRLSNQLKICLCGSRRTFRKGKTGLNKGVAKPFLRLNHALDKAADDSVTGSMEIARIRLLHIVFSERDGNQVVGFE